MDDPDLFNKASQGDPGAMDELLARHLSGLRAFIRLRTGKLLRAKESQSDLVQSVCREVLQGAEAFEYRGDAAFKKWLYTAALRKLVERQRYYLRDKRDAAREVKVPTPYNNSDDQLIDAYRSFATPSHNAAVREQMSMVEEAFDELPEHYRDVIVLTRVLGMTQREAAEELGKTEIAVQRMLKRAVVKLSGILHKRGAGGSPSDSDGA